MLTITSSFPWVRMRAWRGFPESGLVSKPRNQRQTQALASPEYNKMIAPNTLSTFDYPGLTFTSLNGINARGLICGRYVDASGIAHGIIAHAKGVPSANEAGTEMKSPVTPLNHSPSAWGGATPTRWVEHRGACAVGMDAALRRPVGAVPTLPFCLEG